MDIGHHIIHIILVHLNPSSFIKPHFMFSLSRDELYLSINYGHACLFPS
jgi:hypothetical protein